MATGNGKVMRVAQIGCGQIAPQHFKGYAASALVELAMVVDVDATAAQEAAAANGNVPWTTSFEEAVARDDVDVVSIATPHYLHASQAVAAAGAKKHVLCEKPLTTSVEDADRMIEACAANGVRLGMWMVMRYTGAARLARRLIQAGAIGEIVNIRLPDVHNKTRNYYERGVGGRARPSAWRGSRKMSGGGALIMNAIHQIDVLRYITRLEVQRVSAEWTSFTGLAEVEDMINVVLRYENGAIGTIDTANYAPGGGEANVLRIYGATGQLQIARGSELKAYVERPFDGGEGLPALEPDTWQDVPAESAGDTRTLVVDDFVRAVHTGQEPPITGGDGRAAIETVLAAYVSAEQGRTVTLPLPRVPLGGRILAGAS
ncbi:MAG: Gfo/Idh/MocA family oxidoreductase [Chloroflexota bacterium]|nr:Gfo/Idh/MocA family oxidoreductase [Chloroflexota bacterium]